MRYWRIVAVLALTGCATAPPVTQSPTHLVVSAPRATALRRTCVELSQVREARVVDDRTIDFYLSGREVLRNTLPVACPALGHEKTFTYSPSLDRLCPVDPITVVVSGGGPRRGATCALGNFAAPPPAK